MTWQLGESWLLPGQSVTWTYWWGDYKGLQVARPKPLSLINGLITVSHEGAYQEWDESSRRFVYYYTVTLTNESIHTTRYYLTGGEVL